MAFEIHYDGQGSSDMNGDMFSHYSLYPWFKIEVDVYVLVPPSLHPNFYDKENN